MADDIIFHYGTNAKNFNSAFNAYFTEITDPKFQLQNLYFAFKSTQSALVYNSSINDIINKIKSIIGIERKTFIKLVKMHEDVGITNYFFITVLEKKINIKCEYFLNNIQYYGLFLCESKSKFNEKVVPIDNKLFFGKLSDINGININNLNKKKLLDNNFENNESNYISDNQYNKNNSDIINYNSNNTNQNQLNFHHINSNINPSMINNNNQYSNNEESDFVKYVFLSIDNIRSKLNNEELKKIQEQEFNLSINIQNTKFNFILHTETNYNPFTVEKQKLNNQENNMKSFMNLNQKRKKDCNTNLNNTNNKDDDKNMDNLNLNDCNFVNNEKLDSINCVINKNFDNNLNKTNTDQSFLDSSVQNINDEFINNGDKQEKEEKIINEQTQYKFDELNISQCIEETDKSNIDEKSIFINNNTIINEEDGNNKKNQSNENKNTSDSKLNIFNNNNLDFNDNNNKNTNLDLKENPNEIQNNNKNNNNLNIKTKASPREDMGEDISISYNNVHQIQNFDKKDEFSCNNNNIINMELVLKRLFLEDMFDILKNYIRLEDNKIQRNKSFPEVENNINKNISNNKKNISSKKKTIIFSK